MRKDVVLKALADNGLSLADLQAVVGRGGLLRPIPHGTYAVSDDMVGELRAGTRGDNRVRRIRSRGMR